MTDASSSGSFGRGTAAGVNIASSAGAAVSPYCWEWLVQSHCTCKQPAFVYVEYVNWRQARFGQELLVAAIFHLTAAGSRLCQ